MRTICLTGAIVTDWKTTIKPPTFNCNFSLKILMKFANLAEIWQFYAEMSNFIWKTLKIVLLSVFCPGSSQAGLKSAVCWSAGFGIRSLVHVPTQLHFFITLQHVLELTEDSINGTAYKWNLDEIPSSWTKKLLFVHSFLYCGCGRGFCEPTHISMHPTEKRPRGNKSAITLSMEMTNYGRTGD